MEYTTVYLGLGSNLGDRKNNLDKALDYISQRMRITMKSSIYDTEALENREQPRFLNMVCQAKTILKPQDLLVLAKAIERKWVGNRTATTPPALSISTSCSMAMRSSTLRN